MTRSTLYTLLLALTPASVPAAPSVPQNSFPTVPLRLEWQIPPGSGWSTDSLDASEGYTVKIRAEGDAEHVGTWVRLVGRVTVPDPDGLFFGPGGPAAEYPGLAGLLPAIPVDLQTVGGADIPGSSMTILSHSELLEKLTDGWCGGCPDPDTLRDYYQPILNSGNFDREWGAEYDYSLESTKSWWRGVLSCRNGTCNEFLINLEGLMQALFEEQTGLNPTWFWFEEDLFEAAVDAGMMMELQLLSISGANTDLATFPASDGEGPPPSINSWVATGTSNALCYTFTSTQSNINGLAFFMDPVMAFNPVQPGECVEIKLNALYHGTVVEMHVEGHPMQILPIFPAASGAPMTGEVCIPDLGLTSNTQLRFKRYVNPIGGVPIPYSIQEKFTYIAP